MKLIPVKMTKATLYFYEHELAHLLSLNPGLWAAAIKRGKRMKRARAVREPKIKGGAER